MTSQLFDSSEDERPKDATPPPARIRGRWWLLAKPGRSRVRHASSSGQAKVYLADALQQTGEVVPPLYGSAISPPAGTEYQLIYLTALPAEYHSLRRQPTAAVLDHVGLDSDLRIISQSYDDLFTACKEIPLLPLEHGIVRIALRVSPRFTIDRAGVIRIPADRERHPDLGAWEEGSALDKLLQWHFWWAPEQVAADWAPDLTRRWLEQNGGIHTEEETRLMQLAERAGLGEVAAGRAYRCARARCLEPLPKERAIRRGHLFYHERCLSPFA